MIRSLANLKLRRKLLIAMAPLALMVVIACAYSTFESKSIDTLYSNMIDTEVKGLRSLTEARSHTNRYGMFLYDLVAETDPDRKQVIDGELEKTRADYQAVSSAAVREIPERADKINAAAALFDKTVADARPVRAAALAGNNEKALSLLHAGGSDELQQARQAAIGIVEELQTAIDQRSDELTRNTHHAIVVTWLVIGFGLLASLGAAFYIVQTEVVEELSSLQGSIRDLADGKLDQPILFLDHRNEIGEISRAVRTLQGAAREREIQGWVKSEVAATLTRIQAAEDFEPFAQALLSSISECIPLVYGSLYLVDKSNSHFTRVGAFAIEDAGSPREFALGEGLVGQAAVERRVLTVTAGESLFVRCGVLQLLDGLGTVVSVESELGANRWQV